jgi:phosphoribosylformylglycinamidine synthase subunit PurL
MNFGNPERPEVMWAFSEAVRGLTDACTALETPVTGGNVSFYNESGDSAIWPTPIVGMLGLMEDYRLMLRPAFSDGGLVILQLGETFPELGGSAFAEAVLGTVAGRPPALDLEKEKALQELLVDAAAQDLLASAHDCSEGGLAVALAECAMAGNTGFAVSLRADVPAHVTLFSESASRAVVAVRPERADALQALASARGVPCERLGETGGPSMMFAPHVEVSVAEARAVYEESIPKLMAG